MTKELFLKNRFLVSTIAFGLLLLAVLILLIIPALNDIRLINKQVYEERIRLEKLYVRGQLQKQVRDNYSAIEAKLPVLDEMILKEGQELQYITAVERIAADAGVALNIDAGQYLKKPEQEVITLPFIFRVTGAWPNLLRWLSGLEALPYYTNINSATITAPDKDGQARQPALTVSANTYWIRIPSSLNK